MNFVTMLVKSKLALKPVNGPAGMGEPPIPSSLSGKVPLGLVPRTGVPMFVVFHDVVAIGVAPIGSV